MLADDNKISPSKITNQKRHFRSDGEEPIYRSIKKTHRLSIQESPLNTTQFILDNHDQNEINSFMVNEDGFGSMIGLVSEKIFEIEKNEIRTTENCEKINKMNEIVEEMLQKIKENEKKIMELETALMSEKKI